MHISRLRILPLPLLVDEYLMSFPIGQIPIGYSYYCVLQTALIDFSVSDCYESLFYLIVLRQSATVAHFPLANLRVLP